MEYMIKGEGEDVVERPRNHELESCHHYQQQKNYYDDALKENKYLIYLDNGSCGM